MFGLYTTDRQWKEELVYIGSLTGAQEAGRMLMEKNYACQFPNLALIRTFIRYDRKLLHQQICDWWFNKGMTDGDSFSFPAHDGTPTPPREYAEDYWAGYGKGRILHLTAD